MATVPFKDSGIPGVRVATYSTPACNKHIKAEQAAEYCPYCVLSELLKTCGAPAFNTSQSRRDRYDAATTRAHKILSGR